MVKIAQFGAVCKAHSVTEPVETIGQNNLALTARRQTTNVNSELHCVTVFEVDLAGMRRSK